MVANPRIFAIPFTFFFLCHCSSFIYPSASQPSVRFTPKRTLLCSSEGSPRVIKITPRVWVALGYELANTFLIKTNEGNVIVDPGMSESAVLAKKNDLWSVSPGPIRAILYTHSHIDHIGGAGFWAEATTEIWAHEDFPQEFFKQYGTFRTLEARRGARQFGFLLSEEESLCSAIGPIPKGAMKVFPLLPTRTFSQAVSIQVGGVEIHLIHAPGETRDQTYIFLPEEGILFIGDNFYASFPNLYTIRGTSPRPVDLWIQSLDLARNLEPHFLLPSHTAPIAGKERIQEVLRNYRDAIQYVHDSVIHLALKEVPLPRIAEVVQLPPSLKDLPYLAEGYGAIPWSVKGIYESYLGWFDGRPETLVEPEFVPTLIREIELMGGVDAVMAEITKREEEGEFLLALHFSAKLYHSGLSSPDVSHKEITRKYLDLLKVVADRSQNTNLHYYLLSYAKEKEGRSLPSPVLLSSSVLPTIPIENFLTPLRYLLKKEAGEVWETMGFRFPDLGMTIYVTIRNGIVEIQKGSLMPGNPPPLAVLICDSQLFRELALKQRSYLISLLGGKVRIEGSMAGAIQFLKRFEETEPPAIFQLP